MTAPYINICNKTDAPSFSAAAPERPLSYAVFGQPQTSTPVGLSVRYGNTDDAVLAHRGTQVGEDAFLIK